VRAAIYILLRSWEALILCPQIDMIPPRTVENSKVNISMGKPVIEKIP
jgi:hypothetical protein